MKRYELSRDYRHGIGMPEVIECADGRFVRWEDVQRLREALAVAHDHIDMSRLEISHCKDATLIRAALSQEQKC